MAWIQGLVASFIEKLATRVAEEAILAFRKNTKMNELGKQASDLKKELNNAQSTAEREAVLDKVHDLINGFGSI